MKMFTKAATALLIAGAGLQIANALADTSGTTWDNRGWYVGGELSYASGESKARGQTNLDENGLGFGAYGGYNFTNWFGLEGTSFQSDNMAGDRTGLDNAEFFTLSFTPKFTANLNDRFGVYFKAGPTFVRYTEEYEYSEDRYYWDDEFDWSEIILGAGIGAVIRLQEGVNLRLAYDYVSGTVEESFYDWDAPNERVDVTLGRFAIGMHYQF